jgi:hypothetical protein
LNKWDFLMVFQAAERPIRRACKSVIRKAVRGLEGPGFKARGAVDLTAPNRICAMA